MKNTKHVFSKMFLLSLILCLSILQINMKISVYAVGPGTTITTASDITTSGTYYITDASGLIALSNYVNSGNSTSSFTFIAMNDFAIDLDATSWVPISVFKGTLRGNTGNESITITNTSGKSFIESAESSANISDLSFVVVNDITKVTTTEAIDYGIIANTFSGTMNNITLHYKGTAVVKENYSGDGNIGLLFGYNAGSITNCVLNVVDSTIEIEGNQSALFVGSQYNGTGNLNNNTIFVKNSTISIGNSSQSYSTNTYTKYASIFAGDLYGNATNNKIDVVNSDITLSSSFAAGGFTAYSQVSSLTTRVFENNYITFDETSSLHLNSNNNGGMIGKVFVENSGNYVVNHSYIDALINVLNSHYASGGFLGGMTGTSAASVSIEDSFATGEFQLLNGSYAGGFGGYINAQNVIINKTYHSGTLRLSPQDGNSWNSHGGVWGDMNGSNSTIKNSYQKGTITIINDKLLTQPYYYYVGGFVGSNTITVQNNFVIGEMTSEITGSGSNFVPAGFVGSNAGNVYNSFTSIVAKGTGSDIEYFLADDSTSTGVYSNNHYFSSYQSTGLNGIDTVSNTVTGVSDTDTTEINTTNLLGILNYDSPTDETNDAFTYPYNLEANDAFYPVLIQDETDSDTAVTYAKQLGTQIGWMATATLDDGTVKSTSSNSVIKSIPLIETHHIELSMNEATFELGDVLTMPKVIGYKLYGYFKTDLTSHITQSGTFDLSKVGDYEIVYKLSAYNYHTNKQDEVTSTYTIHLVDTTPPTIVETLPEIFLYGKELNLSDYVLVNDLQEVTKKVTISSSNLGTQSVLIEAIDASGNSVTVSKEVTIVVPKVEVYAAKYGMQQILFVLNEREFDLETISFRYTWVSTNETSSNGEWAALATIQYQEGKTLKVQAVDQYGRTISRSFVTKISPDTSSIEISKLS